MISDRAFFIELTEIIRKKCRKTGMHIIQGEAPETYTTG
jgi:hypothetical protein